MENLKTESKVIVVVNGGVVQSIYSNDPKLRYEVLDIDDLEYLDDKLIDKIFESITKNLIPIL